MKKKKDKKGKLVIVSGPSGVGKSTVCREAAGRMKNVYLSVSVTSRPKSKKEIDGKDYWFVTEEEFRGRIGKGLFLEYAEVFGNMYGTPKDMIEKALEERKTVILEIDVQGARQVKALYPDAVMIFILPPSAKVLEKRITHRGREKEEMIQKRLGEADSEIAAAWQYYKYMIINDDLEQATEEMIDIVQQSNGGS